MIGSTRTGLGEDRSATLEGDVRVRSEDAMPFEATAARASIASGGRSAEKIIHRITQFARGTG